MEMSMGGTSVMFDQSLGFNGKPQEKLKYSVGPDSMQLEPVAE